MALANIIATGARGPLGLSSQQLALNIKAAKSEPRGCSLRDKRDWPVGICLTGGLRADTHRGERLLALAAPAIRETCRNYAGDSLGLVIALPETDRPDAQVYDDAFVAKLIEQSGANVDTDRIQRITVGHAGGAFALQAAVEQLGGGAQAVLVGGVDSYYDPEVIEWLDDACRLHSIDTEDGIVPSEGAAFALLQAPQANEGAIAQIEHIGLGVEEAIKSGETNAATTLTQLLRAAISEMDDVRWVMSDVNGERHRVREWTMAALRSQFIEGIRHDQLAGELHDVGAATGATLLATAAVWLQSAHKSESHVLIATHSESGERGVFGLGVAS